MAQGSSRLLPFLLAAGFLATGPRPAAACSCADSPTPCQAFDTSPIVFVGDVLSAEEAGNDFHMRLRVVRPLKGITDTIADVWSDAISSCGVKLEEGGRYVIYTSRVDGRMSIYACGYGRQLAPGEPLPELPPVAGRVYGVVTRYDIDRIRNFDPLARMPAVRVNLDLPAGRVSAVTDQWGLFRFSNVPPGKHALTADAGQGMTGDSKEPLIMPTGRDCIDTQIVLRPSGKLSGRVLTADGKPAFGIYLRLLPDGPAGSELHQEVGLAQTTGPDGRFSIEGLDPDNYVVAVNPDGVDATGRQPYAPAFFGGANRKSARRIPLGVGAAVELDRPFVLPVPLATRTLTVAVTCRDRSVPTAITVRAMATNGARFAEFEEPGNDPVRTLRLVRDQAYTLLVSIYIPGRPELAGRGGRREEQLAPIQLPAGEPGRHVALMAPFISCAEQ